MSKRSTAQALLGGVVTVRSNTHALVLLYCSVVYFVADLVELRKGKYMKEIVIEQMSF